MGQFRKFNILILFIIVISLNGVLSYGWVGHQLTAAIAQRFLTPRAQRAIIELLPPEANGSLSAIAHWADTIRSKPHYRFSTRLHFWNPANDNPPETCSCAWIPGRYDVITAIYNYSHRLDPKTGLEYTQQAEALKFLVHFLGDLHQPLHLTTKLKGGNGAIARFDNRKTSLHTIWDSHNSHVRVDFFQYDRISFSPPRRRPIRPPFPIPEVPDSICPNYWAIDLKKLNCEIMWKGYDPDIDYGHGKFYDALMESQLVEKLLAMAGIRMAAILNTILT
ncbi:13665_t:CDS:2 [Ambispora gerdemannii]|uniref:13665_t:CDS:1 n=1 Tax=Ambispora gerdemannii TaxID=144530 RepID=A0A9N8WHL4_9GLOM|nr:13665_t:CDS:2 [Ambispora gerdemannii]